jgi:probable phosphoglycerate mutase
MQQQRSSMQQKKTIFLIRHGETDYNKRGIVQGSGINSDLNETGREQARRFHAHYLNEPFDRIYTSTLNRTKQTVAPFVAQGLPHVEHKGLDEINWGIYEGKESPQFWEKVFPEISTEWRNGNLDYRIPGGESPVELQTRQRLALDFIMQQEQERQLLVCMHGRAMRSFLCLLLNLPLSRMDDFPHNNLGLYVLEYVGSEFELKRSNDLTHLLNNSNP